ncbi:MAG: helix-turn-helix transcriptional regulator [Kofleriaceae bacterium]|nr:helix-turn-helix transcriptional regulator [Kofleriaceae bacterium]
MGRLVRSLRASGRGCCSILVRIDTVTSNANQYQEHRPSPPLTEFVECYWTARNSTGFSGIVFPDGCVDILVEQSGDNFTQRIVGAMTHALILRGSEKRDTIAIRFSPGGIRALLGVSPVELVDTSTSLENVLRGPGLRVAHLPVAQAIVELDRWLLVHLPGVDAKARNSARIARACIESRYSTVAALSDAFGISRQHLRRQVLAATGLGPKELGRIGRMRRLSQWITAGTIPNADVAVLAGYYDQAHMVNEFRQLSGMTPGAYAKSLYRL